MMTSGGFRVQQPEPEPRDEWGQRLKAERDALLELIAIFTHDLSNPLQSLTVLCELGIDEAPPGSDDRLRNEQCLEAATRMRSLIHGLAGITRRGDGGPSVQTTVERVWSLLGRRFDRSRMTADRNTTAIDRLILPEGFDFALINLLLAAIGSISDAGRGPHHMIFEGKALEGQRARLGVRVTSAGEPRALKSDGTHCQRIRAYLNTVPEARLIEDEGGLYIEFDALEQP